MKRFKKIIAMSLATMMVLSVMSMSVFASSNEYIRELVETDEVLTFTKMDENGNVIGEYPLLKTEVGYNQAYVDATSTLAMRSTLPVWNLSNTYTLTRSFNAALYKLPYRFTGTAGKGVYVNANINAPNSTWVEIAINNVTNGTVYVGSVPLDYTSGNLFSINGRLNGISSSNYYTYTLQAQSNFTYAEIELYQK